MLEDPFFQVFRDAGPRPRFLRSVETGSEGERGNSMRAARVKVVGESNDVGGRVGHRRCRAAFLTVVFGTIACLLTQGFAIKPAGASLAGPVVSQALGFTPCYGQVEEDAGGIYGAVGDSCGAWDRLEDAAADDVIVGHGLVNDRELVRRAAPDQLRAAMWVRLLKAINTPVEQRTADEQALVTWSGNVVMKYNLSVLKAALDEFNKFDANDALGSCTYRAPAPYQDEWDGHLWPRCNNQPIYLPVDYPKSDQFVKWGTAVTQARINSGVAAYKSAAAISTELVALASGAAAGAVAAGAFTAIYTSSTLITTLIATIAPYALRAAGSLAATVGGVVGAAAFVITVVVLAIVSIVMGGLALASRDATLNALNQAVADTFHTGAVDMPLYLSNADSLTLFFNLFADYTTSSGLAGTVLEVPARQASDPVFDRSTGETASTTFIAADWQGNDHTIEVRGGYFVVDGTVPAASINIRDASNAIAKRTLTRVKKDGVWQFAMIPVEPEGPTSCIDFATCPVSSTITVQVAGRPVTVTSRVNTAPTIAFEAALNATEGRPTPLSFVITDPDSGPAPQASIWRSEPCIFPASTPDGPTFAAPPGSCWRLVGRPTPALYETNLVATANAVFPDDGPVVVVGRYTDGLSPYVEISRTQTVRNANPEFFLSDSCAVSTEFNCNQDRVDEGDTIVLHGVIQDPGVLDLEHVVINWADGSQDRFDIGCAANGVLVFNGNGQPRQALSCNPGLTFSGVGTADRAFTFRHVAIDGLPLARATARYSWGDDGNEPFIGGFLYEVRNVAPTVALGPSCGALCFPLPPTEGATFTLPGTVSDPGLNDRPTVVVTFDNGIAPQTPTITRNGTSGTFSMTVQIPYGATALNATAVATDKDGATSTTTYRTSVSALATPAPVVSNVTATAVASAGSTTVGAKVSFAAYDGRALAGVTGWLDTIAGPGTALTTTPNPSDPLVFLGPASFTVSGQVPVNGATPGTHTIFVRAADIYGRTHTSSTTFSVDGTGPVITVPAPISAPATSPSGATVTYSATATDAVDGTVAVTCTPPSGSLFPLGSTTVSCTATDNVGNRSTASFAITVEKPGGDPGVERLTVVARTNGASIAVAASGTANGTDVQISSGRYWIDSTLGTGTAFTGTFGSSSVALSATADISALTDGTHTVYVAVTDTFARTSPTASAAFVVDRTAPFLTVPTNFSLTGTSTAGGVVTYTATADDTTDGAITPVCRPVSGATFVAGPTTVSCEATDATGNTGAASFVVTVVVPGTAPSISRIGVPSATGASPLTVKATATTAVTGSTITSARMWLDTKTGPGTAMTGQFGRSSVDLTGSFDITALPEGTHQVFVRATDSGFRETTVMATVVVDRTAPTIAPTVTPNPVPQGLTAVVTANAADSGSGLRSVKCTQPDTRTAGAKTISCTAIDRAGNRSTGTANYTVTASADVAVSVSTPGSVRSGESFTVTLTLVNRGLSAAAATTATMTFNPSLLSPTNLGTATVSGGTLTWPTASLAVGASRTLTLTFRATAQGSAIIGATATSSTFDVNPSNNTARRTIAIR